MLSSANSDPGFPKSLAHSVPIFTAEGIASLQDTATLLTELHATSESRWWWLEARRESARSCDYGEERQDEEDKCQLGVLTQRADRTRPKPRQQV